MLSVLLGVKPKLHVHSEGTDLRILLKGKLLLNFEPLYICVICLSNLLLTYNRLTEIASGKVTVEKKDVAQIEAGLP